MTEKVLFTGTLMTCEHSILYRDVANCKNGCIACELEHVSLTARRAMLEILCSLDPPSPDTPSVFEAINIAEQWLDENSNVCC